MHSLSLSLPPTPVSCKISLVGRVNVVVNKRQADGSHIRVADVEVGDETGTVFLRARDEQIDILREASERNSSISSSNNNLTPDTNTTTGAAGCLAIVLENCTLQLFQGRYIRLAITKWGKMYPDAGLPPLKMNTGRNYSLVDLWWIQNDSSSDDRGEAFQQLNGTGGQQHQNGSYGRRNYSPVDPSLIQNDSYSSCDRGETFQQLNITGGPRHYGIYTVGDRRKNRQGRYRGGQGRGGHGGRGRGNGPRYGISRAEYVKRKENEKVQAQLQHVLSSNCSTTENNIPSYGVTSYI